MRCVEPRLTSVIPLFAALVALALACRSESPRELEEREPSTLLTRAPVNPRTDAPAVALPEAVSTSGQGPSMPPEPGVTSMQGAEPDAGVYKRPPVHQTYDSPRYSNVGMPYPIPNADTDVSPPIATPATPPPGPPPSFPETTLGAPAYQLPQGFPESTFRPDAGG